MAPQTVDEQVNITQVDLSTVFAGATSYAITPAVAGFSIVGTNLIGQFGAGTGGVDHYDHHYRDQRGRFGYG